MSAAVEEPEEPDESSITVAFQGEKGAYSEAAVFGLLGRKGVRPVACPSFDEAFQAVSSKRTDLVCVPIENSLGGTIHANCDLQLQHSLFIIAEHHFRVRHCLMALPGTKKEDLTKIISHPQALAQCDSYIKRLGVKGEASYDTAGSAKLIAEGKLQGVAAICSELAASHYGLEILDAGIEDDSKNFTRFLLLRDCPARVQPSVPCKTSIVFSLDNAAGALFKALSVFALRDIDLTKIESRPCKPDVMDKLECLFWGMGGGMHSANRKFIKARDPGQKAFGDEGDAAKPSYRYLFYADFSAPVDEPNSANALKHLQEITSFFRILGSYPCGGALTGLENLGLQAVLPTSVTLAKPKRKVGILGYGTFGQFFGKRMRPDFELYASSITDHRETAAALGVVWCQSLELLLQQRLDVLIVSVSILSFEAVVRKIASTLGKLGLLDHRMLVVDVCSVKVHAKNTMLALLPGSCDILCTHPMFGPQSGAGSWGGLPFVFERVRLLDAPRCEEFLRWWSDQGCRMVDMTCELHDECAAGSQFVTHFTGRVLSKLDLRTTPINTKGFESLLQLVGNTCKDSFDLFYALYKFNPNSAQQLQCIEGAMADLCKELRDGLALPAPPAAGAAAVAAAATDPAASSSG